jgi:hypothetical protein
MGVYQISLLQLSNFGGIPLRGFTSGIESVPDPPFREIPNSISLDRHIVDHRSIEPNDELLACCLNGCVAEDEEAHVLMLLPLI